MHDLIRELQGIAQTGLHYTQDPYDKERYQRLRMLSFELMAALSDADLQELEKFFIPQDGYATPKVDLRACVFRNERVLLVKEREEGEWTLPGGWADQNESPSEGIIRETKEESGFDIEITKLYAIKDRDRGAYVPKYPVSLYKFFFLAEISGGEPGESIEIAAVDFFPLHDLPALSLSRVLPQDIELGYKHYKNSALTPHID